MKQRFRVLNGDSLELLNKLEASSIDSCVCDPPYELGFMGKKWDSTGIANNGELWKSVLRVLKPGAHMVAFGGTRTYHRMVCAIEDAGFEIRDQIGWVYGSGFPKSLDVSKAIDKNNGKSAVSLEPFGLYVRERRKAKGLRLSRLDSIMGTNTAASWWEGRATGIQLPSVKTYKKLKFVLAMDDRFDDLIDWAEADREIVGAETKARSTNGKSALPTCGGETVYETWNLTTPATKSAKKWNGWGTALKPAWEPIVLARKPLIGTVAENVQVHGTGAINVDACRVATNGYYRPQRKRTGKLPKWLGNGFECGSKSVGSTTNGRWPANVIHDGSDEVLAAFAKFGEKTSGVLKAGTKRTQGGGYHGGFPEIATHYDTGGDTGTAARFFYCAKASKRDRDEGLNGFEEVRVKMNNGNNGSDPVSDRFTKIARNNHPTVKPTALMRYLCKLVTPPGGLILDPFTGSGSTGKAAMLEGFRFVGIELSADYAKIARARISGVKRK